MRPIVVFSSGMVTPVGYNAPASCAAMRAQLKGFFETRFDFDGEPLVGCPVPIEESPTGLEKWLWMVASAIDECLDPLGDMPTTDIPLLLCTAHAERPGRPAWLNEGILPAVQAHLGQRFHPDSTLITSGRVGVVEALAAARDMLTRGARHVVLAGVDSLLEEETLCALHEAGRLRTSKNRGGLVPGQAAAAVVVTALDRVEGSQLCCLGIGRGTEPAPRGSKKPHRADGLVSACRHALAESQRQLADLAYRISDCAGAPTGFRETSLVLSRLLREPRPDFPLWQPANSVGDVGTASGFVALGVALAATRVGYALGRGVLVHLSNHDSARAAAVLELREEEV